MAGLIGSLFVKAVSGVKSLVTNAQIGKSATANGFVQGVLSPAQQAQSNAALSIAGLNPWYLIGGFIAFFLLIAAIFSAIFSKRK